MVINEIASKLVTAGLTTGFVVFRGYLPPNPDAAIVVYETGGTAPERFGPPSPYIDRPTIQIVVRGAPRDYATPRLAAEKIYQAMIGWGAFVQDNVRYIDVVALQTPFVFDRDEAERVKFSVNFMLYKELSPTT